MWRIGRCNDRSDGTVSHGWLRLNELTIEMLRCRAGMKALGSFSMGPWPRRSVLGYERFFDELHWRTLFLLC